MVRPSSGSIPGFFVLPEFERGKPRATSMTLFVAPVVSVPRGKASCRSRRPICHTQVDGIPFPFVSTSLGAGLYPDREIIRVSSPFTSIVALSICLGVVMLPWLPLLAAMLLE